MLMKIEIKINSSLSLYISYLISKINMSSQIDSIYYTNNNKNNNNKIETIMMKNNNINENICSSGTKKNDLFLLFLTEIFSLYIYI